MKDYLEFKALQGDGMTPYEQFKTQHMQAKSHTRGLGIDGLTVGVGAAVLDIGSFELEGSRAQNAKDFAVAKNDGLRDLVTTLASTVAAERSERINGDITLSQNITDSISGQQQGTHAQTNSQTTAIDNTMTQIMQQTLSDAITGRSSLNPTPVNIYSAPQPCGCPSCGCNG